MDVVAALGRVVVAFDANAVAVEDLIDTLEELEEAFGVDDRPFPGQGLPHPGDVESIFREAVKVGADALSLALSLPLKMVAPVPGTVRTVAGSFVAVVNGVPRVRSLIVSRFESPLTDVALATVNTLVQGF